jgi:diadenosine tetraphosphate (Ap4A) HIT family hydrolase
MLVIPFRHVPDFFSLTDEEKCAILALVGEYKWVIEENSKPAGSNIGFNAGAAAGQTVMHCHCHIIPRYWGDNQKISGVG